MRHVCQFFAVIGPFFDPFAEVEPNEDAAKYAFSGRRLGELV